jgi:hypothetical protein
MKLFLIDNLRIVESNRVSVVFGSFSSSYSVCDFILIN